MRLRFFGRVRTGFFWAGFVALGTALFFSFGVAFFLVVLLAAGALEAVFLVRPFLDAVAAVFAPGLAFREMVFDLAPDADFRPADFFAALVFVAFFFLVVCLLKFASKCLAVPDAPDSCFGGASGGACPY